MDFTMASKLLSACLVLSVVVSTIAAPKIGDYITPCSLKDPKLGECMAMKAREFLPKIASGVREWNLPSLDPIFVSKMELQEKSGNSAVGVEIGGYNLSFRGYRDAMVESVKADPQSLHFEFILLTPNVTADGMYKIKGKLLLLPISGEGATYFYHEKQRIRLSMDFKRVEKKGKTYMHLDKTRFKIEGLAKAHTYLDNLFNNKQLSDNMNKLLNDNAFTVLAEIGPRFEISLAELALALFGPMFDRIPMSEFFSDA